MKLTGRHMTTVSASESQEAIEAALGTDQGYPVVNQTGHYTGQVLPCPLGEGHDAGYQGVVWDADQLVSAEQLGTDPAALVAV